MSTYYQSLVKLFNIKPFEPEPEQPKNHFDIYGIVSNKYFQKCVIYVQKLYQCCPNDYNKPDIRQMLDVEWNTFVKKLQRKVGSGYIWLLQKGVTVFLNGKYLGDDENLMIYIRERYRQYIKKDFGKIAEEELYHYLKNQSDLGRNFVYITVSIDDIIIGSMLFLIYSDIVPNTSEQFITRCCKRECGYSGRLIQRIAKPSWIQCGGFKLKHFHQACENYVVSHDQRGILSMCNNGKHIDNSTQFFITLSSSTWMDYKYVAFGKLIQGDNILKMIEDVPTYYEKPLKKIKMVKTGEFTLYETPDADHIEWLKKFVGVQCYPPTSEDNSDQYKADLFDVNSELLIRRLQSGMYSAATDLESYTPFQCYPTEMAHKIKEKIKCSDKFRNK